MPMLTPRLALVALVALTSGVPLGAQGPATVVARALGHLPATRDVVLPRDRDSALVLVLERAPATIVPIRVVAAGEYTIAEGVAGALSPLEVARTPGTAATVARAVQTLPGVQNVDEGTGLFVRGGDLLETRVLVAGALPLSPTVGVRVAAAVNDLAPLVRLWGGCRSSSATARRSWRRVRGRRCCAA